MADDLVERARFLASGQDDPHSGTITELCDEIERLHKEKQELALELIALHGQMGERDG